VRAAVTDSHHAIGVVEVADPVPGPSELVIRVTACGICGSDLKARPAMSSGTVMGHEFCGEVVALGGGVGGAWREGIRAAVLPVLSCGTCSWCRSGDVAHCHAARLIGLGGSPGGFAEFAAVSADLSFALPKELTISFFVYYPPEEFRAVIDAFSSGQIDPQPLVTSTVSLDQLDAAFASLAGSTNDGKVLVDPRTDQAGLAQP
jgi:threonine dehydrogenase-like Zn-dependent dehydrogenase